jgi:hypothetical protein
VRTHPDGKLLEQHCYKSAAGLLQLCAFLRVQLNTVGYLGVIQFRSVVTLANKGQAKPLIELSMKMLAYFIVNYFSFYL